MKLEDTSPDLMQDEDLDLDVVADQPVDFTLKSESPNDEKLEEIDDDSISTGTKIPKESNH